MNLSGLSAENDFSGPDGLMFDPRGLLWIQTDDAAFTDQTNCMMLAAVVGKVGDGEFVAAAGGAKTPRGAVATPTTLWRFLVGPRECEITGMTMTPDKRTLFINIQHPGERTVPDFAAKQFGSTWPSGVHGPKGGRPRSATIAICRTDGGELGT